MSEQSYHVAGFSFANEDMGKLAEKEMKAIAYINKQLDKNHPEAIVELYKSAVSQGMFQTAIGYQYLSELRDFIVSLEAAEASELPDIPVKDEVLISKKEKKEEDEGKRKSKKQEEAAAKDNHIDKASPSDIKYKKRFRYSLIANIAFVVVIAIMLYIASTSNSPTILDYETKLVNKYSSWEQELTEREADLDQREANLKEESNTLMNQVMSQALSEDADSSADETTEE